MTLLLILVALAPAAAQERPLQIIVIGAHPDDCDSCAGGTAIQWAGLGHQVKFLSLTNGDARHQSQGGGALAKRRRAEAEEAGRRLGISEYEVLDNHDGELEPTLAARGQVIRAIRTWNADVVILPRPNDYHPNIAIPGSSCRMPPIWSSFPTSLRTLPRSRRTPCSSIATIPSSGRTPSVPTSPWTSRRCTRQRSRLSRLLA